MTTTPLSDLMAEHADTRSPESYDRFLAVFRDSVVGIVGVQPEGHGLGAGRTTHGDGRLRILAFADPDVASRAPGSPCNAGIPGRVLLQMAASDPESVGLLVNSATRPISLVISQATAESLLDGAAPDPDAGRSRT